MDGWTMELDTEAETGDVRGVLSGPHCRMRVWWQASDYSRTRVQTYIWWAGLGTDDLSCLSATAYGLTAAEAVDRLIAESSDVERHDPPRQMMRTLASMVDAQVQHAESEDGGSRVGEESER